MRRKFFVIFMLAFKYYLEGEFLLDSFSLSVLKSFNNFHKVADFSPLKVQTLPKILEGGVHRINNNYWYHY